MEINLLIGIFISLVCLGLFSGIEIAFHSINKLTVELRKSQGHASGRIVSSFFEKSSLFITTTLFYYTISFVVFVLLVSNFVNGLWLMIHIENFYLRLVVEASFAVFVLFFFILFFRSLFRSKNTLLLTGFASILGFLYNLVQPIARFFNTFSEFTIEYLFDVKLQNKKDLFNRVDLENFSEQNKQNDETDDEFDTELFKNALSLPSLKVRECLVPRKEIEAIEMNSTLQQVQEKFIQTKLSKLVVYERNIDNIIGYIHQLDLFKNPSSISSILLPIPAVPESMGVTDLMNRFTKERKSIAWVVDEFGGTSGIVTMEDLLEEIFGEIHDEYDIQEFEEMKISDLEFIFSGRQELDYLNEKYGFDFPESESETLSGYIISYHETIPKEKERIIVGDYDFEILSVSDTRIESVKMKKLK